MWDLKLTRSYRSTLPGCAQERHFQVRPSSVWGERAPFCRCQAEASPLGDGESDLFSIHPTAQNSVQKSHAWRSVRRPFSPTPAYILAWRLKNSRGVAGKSLDKNRFVWYTSVHNSRAAGGSVCGSASKSEERKNGKETTGGKRGFLATTPLVEIATCSADPRSQRIAAQQLHARNEGLDRKLANC